MATLALLWTWKKCSKAPLGDGGLVEKYLLYVVTLTAPPLFPLAQIRHGEL